MADAQEEVLNFRITGGQQAQSELRGITGELEKHRKAIEDYNSAVAGGGKPTSQQNSAFLRATSASGTFGSGTFNYEDLGKHAEKMQSLIAAGEKAAQSLSDYRAALSKRPELQAVDTRFTDLSMRHASDHVTPDVKNDLAARQQAIESLLARADQVSNPQRRERLTKMAEAEVDAYEAVTDKLYRTPYKNAAQTIQSEVRRRQRAGTPFSVHDFAQYEANVNAGQFVTPDTDPELRERLEHMGRSPLQRAGAFLRQKLSRENIFSSNTGFAAGYAALSLGEEGARAAAESTFFSGQRQTPEAFQRSMVGLAPAGVGLALSPFGPGASMVGAGIASAGAGIFNSISQREETVRVTSEQMSRRFGLSGEAAEKLAKTLTDAADKAGVPIVELASNVNMLSQSVGRFNLAGGLANQSTLETSLGEMYPDIARSQAGFARSNPLAFGYQNFVSGSGPMGQNFSDAARFEAITGNLDYKNQVAGATVQGDSAATLDLRARLARSDRAQEDHPTWADRLIPGVSQYHLVQRARAHEELQKRLSDAEAADKAAGAANLTQGPLAVETASLYDLGRTTGARAQAAGSLAGVYETRAGVAMMTGGGLAGERGAVGQQVAALRAQQVQLLTYVHTLQGLQAKANPKNREMYGALIADSRRSLEQNRAGIAQAQVGLFREGLSEQESEFSTGYSRLGTAGSLNTLMGGSVFGAAARGNVAARRGSLASRSGVLDALAADKSNFLSPQERDADVAQAAQMRLQRQAILNQEQMQRIGERQAQSGYRGSVIGIGAAEAQTRGTAAQVYAQDTARLDEQHRLQGELTSELQRGNLTLEQRLSLQSRINDSVAQEKVGRIAARNALIESLQAQAGAAAQGMATRASRLDVAEGSSTGAVRARLSNYAETRTEVALAQARYLSDPDPKNRTRNFAALEDARRGQQQSGIEAASVVESPQARTARAQMQGTMERQNISIFEPGAPITEAARLNQMDAQRMRAIQQRRVLLRQQGMLQPEVEEQLVAQEEPIRTQMLERQNTMNLGWMDRLTSQSINAPSFASRVMPPPSDIAALAERRGLGAMSSRLFGFTKRTSYDAAQMLGFMPADVSRMAFGHRPGDFPDAGGGVPFGMAGDGGPLSAGHSLPTSALGSGSSDRQLTDVLSLLAATITKGLTITVNIPEPGTGKVASQTVNAGQNNNSRGLMRGGAAPWPGQGMGGPRYGM